MASNGPEGTQRPFGTPGPGYRPKRSFCRLCGDYELRERGFAGVFKRTKDGDGNCTIRKCATILCTNKAVAFTTMREMGKRIEGPGAPLFGVLGSWNGPEITRSEANALPGKEVHKGNGQWDCSDDVGSGSTPSPRTKLRFRAMRKNADFEERCVQHRMYRFAVAPDLVPGTVIDIGPYKGEVRGTATVLHTGYRRTHPRDTDEMDDDTGAEREASFLHTLGEQRTLFKKDPLTLGVDSDERQNIRQGFTTSPKTDWLWTTQKAFEDHYERIKANWPRSVHDAAHRDGPLIVVCLCGDGTLVIAPCSELVYRSPPGDEESPFLKFWKNQRGGMYIESKADYDERTAAPTPGDYIHDGVDGLAAYRLYILTAFHFDEHAALEDPGANFKLDQAAHRYIHYMYDPKTVFRSQYTARMLEDRVFRSTWRRSLPRVLPENTHWSTSDFPIFKTDELNLLWTKREGVTTLETLYAATSAERSRLNRLADQLKAMEVAKALQKEALKSETQNNKKRTRVVQGEIQKSMKKLKTVVLDPEASMKLFREVDATTMQEGTTLQLRLDFLERLLPKLPDQATHKTSMEWDETKFRSVVVRLERKVAEVIRLIKESNYAEALGVVQDMKSLVSALSVKPIKLSPRAKEVLAVTVSPTLDVIEAEVSKLDTNPGLFIEMPDDPDDLGYRYAKGMIQSNARAKRPLNEPGNKEKVILHCNNTEDVLSQETLRHGQYGYGLLPTAKVNGKFPPVMSGPCYLAEIGDVPDEERVEAVTLPRYFKGDSHPDSDVIGDGPDGDPITKDPVNMVGIEEYERADMVADHLNRVMNGDDVVNTKWKARNVQIRKKHADSAASAALSKNGLGYYKYFDGAPKGGGATKGLFQTHV